MIDRDAKPIEHLHRNPYKRIDLAHPKRRPVITEEDIANGVADPDPRYYDFNFGTGTWRLRT